jgi:hypothetical protein
MGDPYDSPDTKADLHLPYLEKICNSDKSDSREQQAPLLSERSSFIKDWQGQY